MFIKYEKKTNKKTNEVKTFIRIVEGYRADGTIKQRPIKSFGYLEDQPNKEEFLKLVNEELNNLNNQKKDTTNNSDNKRKSIYNIPYNYGYAYLNAVYSFLNIDSFIEKYQNNLDAKEKYKMNDIVKFLVMQRILCPCSKRATMQRINNLYNCNYQFTLDDIYRSFDHLHNISDSIQVHIRNSINSKLKLDTSKVYYDVTNYYCEIDFNDPEENLRHRGVSKEHRVDPIIGMGLFIDSSGIPLKMKIFNGNTSESITLIPAINDLKSKYALSKIIVVADKGLNTNPNINELIENSDGYVFSQILRGPKGKRYHQIMFNEDGYSCKYDSNGELVYKSKIFFEDYEYINKDKIKKTVKRKILIYWDIKDEYITRKKRDEKISRAKKALKNNAITIPKGAEEYLKNEIVDKKSNLKLESAKITKILNEDKVKEDEKFDGYFCLITSEINYNEEDIRKVYHELWKIEETFKITKSDLLFRPLYHYKKEHIIVHFMICYIALMVIRLFQLKLKEKNIELSAERIVRVLDNLTLKVKKSGYVALNDLDNIKAYISKTNPNTNQIIYSPKLSIYNQVESDWELINKAFNIKHEMFDDELIKVERFNQILKNIKM